MGSEGELKRGEASLIKLLPPFELVRKGSLRGAKPLYRNYIPLPLNKGKGIKGIGLINI